jgi:Protein of unknown function (DUF2716)
MNAWVELTKREQDKVWDKFYKEFKFSPSTSKFPGILEPTPSITYSIPYPWTDDDIDDFYEKARKVFREVLPQNQRLYALDWQHACFWFYPHISGKWKIGLPNGDYAIFLAEDFSFGLFGHPWEVTLCVFGQPLLRAFQKYPPCLFKKVIRKDGKPV